MKDRMKKNMFQLYCYLIYQLTAKNKHGTHSPFVFDLLNKVIYNRNLFYAYSEIEKRRDALSSSKEEINFRDLGAGANEKQKDQLKKVKRIARKSVKSAKYGQLLFRLVNYFQPKTVLELGTSLGITTSYLRAAHTQSEVTTIEGSPEIAEMAKKNWCMLGYNDIQLVVGNFDDTLPQILKDKQKLDFVFFDGNHRKQATMDYFNECLKNSHEKSIFVVDDIYWSPEMKEAWELIKADEQVTVTIDLFYLGLVFFRKGQVKQNFVIRY